MYISMCKDSYKWYKKYKFENVIAVSKGLQSNVSYSMSFLHFCFFNVDINMKVIPTHINLKSDGFFLCARFNLLGTVVSLY